MATHEQAPLAAAFRSSGIAFAYLFGSRATGVHTETSDADIAVMPQGELSLLEIAGLADDLAGALDVAEIDVVRLDRAGLELRGRVVQEGRLLFSADEPARVAFEVKTRSEYFDYLPTLEAHTRRYLRQVAQGGLAGRA